jgi:thiamine biosynthesis protein ThiS
VNGEPLEIAGPMTISALLAELRIDARRVAVEHNLIVVQRTRYDAVVVREGDEIEIVNFVGGGNREPETGSQGPGRG